MQWLAKIWHKYLLGAQQPWAIEKHDASGSLMILDYNHAYLKDIRSRLPDEMISSMSNQQVIQLWIDRYNHEHVEPKLEVVHAGIDEHGQIKMKLDWNHMFIKLLKRQGVPGETEEEMVENYLMMVTRDQREDAIAEDMVDALPGGAPDEADIDTVLDTMDPAMVRRLEKTIRRRAQSRGAARTRALDQ